MFWCFHYWIWTSKWWLGGNWIKKIQRQLHVYLHIYTVYRNIQTSYNIVFWCNLYSTFNQGNLKWNEHYLQFSLLKSCVITAFLYPWDSLHCVKIVQIWSYFLSLFSCIRTEHRPEITPYLDNFHAAYFKLDTISNEYW